MNEFIDLNGARVFLNELRNEFVSKTDAAEFVKLTVPVQDGTLTYNGATQSPCWLHYDSGKMTIGGTISAVNAGEYSATFTPKTNFTWQDGTATTQTVTWNIQRAVAAVNLPFSSITFSHVDDPTEFQFSVIGGGEVSASSSNDGIVSASVDNVSRKISFTLNGVGNATITLSTPQSANFSPASNAVNVTVKKLLDIYTYALLKGEAPQDPLFDECGNEWFATHSLPGVDSDVKKFGYSSLYCEKLEQFFQLNNIILGGEPFTIDFWCYFNPTDGHGTSEWRNQTQILLAKQTDPKYVLWEVYCLQYNKLWLSIANRALDRNANITLPYNTWMHFAFTYDGSYARAFLNGSCYGYISASIGQLNIFVQNCNSGYLTDNVRVDTPRLRYDNLRISKGIARWTTDFTPPDLDAEYYVVSNP